MLTVKQIADRAGVSKTTVTKYLKAYEAEHKTEAAEQITKNEQNIIQISDELSEKLLEAILNQKENRQPTANPTANPHKQPQTVSANPTEEPQTVCTNPPPTAANYTANDCKPVQTVSANPPQTANPDAIAALNRVIETQQAQIDQLNKTLDQYQQDKLDLKEQLTVKDEQIKQLNILLSQQQQLHQTLQVKLLETEAGADQTENEEAEKKTGFSLFRRRKKK